MEEGGQQIEVFGRKLPGGAVVWVALGVGVVILLASRRGAQSGGAGSSQDAAAAYDAAAALAATQTDLAVQQAGIDAERRRADQEYDIRLRTLALTERAQATSERCISLAAWQALSREDRKRITSQSGNGKLVIRPSGAGLCFSTTERGQEGHDPRTVVESDAGLLSSNYRASGVGIYPTGPTQQGPILGEVLTAIASILGQFDVGSLFGGSASGRERRRPAPPASPPIYDTV